MIIGFLFLPSPYTIMIALPIFIVGLLMVWGSNQSTKFILLCTILPIVLFYPYAQLVGYLYKNNLGPETKIDLIIEDDFVGKIIIVNNLTCPDLHDFDKRTRIVVPANGITHYPGTPRINSIYTRVIERRNIQDEKELKWHEFSEGAKGIVSEGSNGVRFEDKSYELNVIEIGYEISLDFAIKKSLKEEIIQYIKNCEN